MLKLTRKKYEIEEPIQLEDENGNIIYEFTMQITAEEKEEIKKLIFDESAVKNGRKLSKLEQEGKMDEYEELETKVLEKAKINQEKMEEICFKEHRKPFKDKAGAKYYEMVDMLFDFFVETFVDKRVSQMNTLNTHLRKISNK